MRAWQPALKWLLLACRSLRPHLTDPDPCSWPVALQLIPTSVRHPLETYLGTLLQLYLPPTKRGHVRPLNGSKNGDGAGFALCRPDPSMVLSPSPPAQAPHAAGQQLVGSTPAGAEAGYAGGHAVYLACLVATQAGEAAVPRREQRPLGAISWAASCHRRCSAPVPCVCALVPPEDKCSVGLAVMLATCVLHVKRVLPA